MQSKLQNKQKLAVQMTLYFKGAREQDAIGGTGSRRPHNFPATTGGSLCFN